MERITNKQELIAWAKRVEQNGGGAKAKCIRQDEYMHSQSKDIESAYKELDQNEIKTVSCAIYNVLSMDILWELIRAKAKHIAYKEQEELFREYGVWQDKQNAELSNRLHDVIEKERTVKDLEKEALRRAEVVPELESKITYLQGRIQELSQWINTLREYEEKANKYDELRRLLA